MGNGSTVDTITVDAIPIDSSTNLVTSGGVKVAIDNLEDGTIPVALAENLTSDSAQSSADTFIERTTGGTASLSDGDGWIQLIRGTHTHTGYTPGSAVMTVTPASHSLTASIVEATFLSQVSGNSGTKVFSYNNGWNETLATYGITLTNGTSPINGDYIQVDWEIIEDVVMTVTSPEEDITAEINDATFLGQVSGDSGTMTFSYTSSWDTNPTSYGITITGTPTEGDSISVDWTITRTVTMAVVPIIHTLSATINEETFLGQMSSASGTFSFNYTTGWSPNPASYGITITGSPISGDSISVTYVTEVRGTITQSNPLAFKSSGWNLYDHSKGYARVLKYSDTYGFGISGTYTSLTFSTTTTGGSTITVTDGRFTIPSDGYVIVTGGNDTDTQIWMTWSDWTSQANGGTWEAYAESTVDFSSLIGSGNVFPYGLCEVGSYRDEINFSSGVAIQNVGRVDWSIANLATVRTYETDYEYDENYIYYGLSAPVTTTISINNTVKAYDHGMEWFTNTTQEVYAQTLYGTNLKNKLERDVVTISQQNINPNGQKQVKENIGAIDGVNENLINNWYFGNPVNQRGETSFYEVGTSSDLRVYTIDRWFIPNSNSHTTITLNSDSITLAGTNARWLQYLPEDLLNTTYTISALIKNSSNTKYLQTYSDTSLTTQISEASLQINSSNSIQLYSRTFTGKPRALQWVVTSNGGSMDIIAVKLELGNKQTLARNYGTENNPDWRLTEIPNYSDELLKCVGALGDSADPFSYQKQPLGLATNIDIYVDSTNGNDSYAGTEAHPLQTLAAAIAKIPKHNSGATVTIYCEDGTYSSDTPWPGDSSTTVALALGENELTGCQRLRITAKNGSPSTASTPGVIIRGLYLGQCGCLDIELDYLGFSGTNVQWAATSFMGRLNVGYCCFDGVRINCSGPFVNMWGCTFKNITTENAYACLMAYGLMVMRSCTINVATNSTAAGVYAHRNSIVSCAQMTNNATYPYHFAYGGHIFTDNQEYGGMQRIRVNFSNVPAGTANRTYSVRGITASHRLVGPGNVFFSVPNAAAGRINLQTGSGTVTIIGTLNLSTNIEATFEIPVSVTPVAQ